MTIVLIEQINRLANQYFDETVAFRRHIHQHPELSFQEFKTTEYIEKQLQLNGIPTTRKYAETGVVGYIEGKNPSSKCIALRADIDALPITEENTIDYRSINKGVMHACGHDVHSANLFGTACILNNLKNQFNGTIKLIFQAAEEKLPGGASILIKNGVLENPKVEAIFGLHVFPELQVGEVGFKSGLYMASSDELHITIHGIGGHAALAKNLKDPIEATNHLLIQLRKAMQDIAENNIPYVIGFGDIEAKGATNVIPDRVKVLGTFRTMNENWRQLAHKKMQTVAGKIESKFGVRIDLEIKMGYPYLYNQEELTNAATNHAIELLGEKNVKNLPIRMSSEDFAYYSHHTKACFFRLGTANGTKHKYSVHTTKFNVHENALLTGMRLMSLLSLQELKNH